MLVASEISRPSPVMPAPTQNSHQIAPPVPTRSASPPTMKPATMMPTATQETVRPWYDGYGPPCPVGPPGTTDVSCIAASLCDVGLPDGASPMVPGSEWFDITAAPPAYLADVPTDVPNIVARSVTLPASGPRVPAADHGKRGGKAGSGPRACRLQSARQGPPSRLPWQSKSGYWPAVPSARASYLRREARGIRQASQTDPRGARHTCQQSSIRSRALARARSYDGCSGPPSTSTRSR